MSKWPLKYRIWRSIHVFINRIAWKLVPTDGYKDPRKNHWIWRLNNWIGNHYTMWFATKGRKL